MTRPPRAPLWSLGAIRRAPKVLLHDHLDGGLRPATVIELADEMRAIGTCPTTDPDELARWFSRSGADRKSLELYLEGFATPWPSCRPPDAIERVAAECVEDLAADGIVYAEVRLAPELPDRWRPDARRGGARPCWRGLRARRGGPSDHRRAAR